MQAQRAKPSTAKNTKDTEERRRGGFPAKTQGAREARWANAGRFAGETPADRSLPPIVFALGNSFNSLRHITKLRGRTHRTYRTTRTAAPPLDSQLPKAWRAKPAMPLQAPGPDVCLTHTHGPPLRTCWHVHRTCRGCREGALCAPENGACRPEGTNLPRPQKTENRTRGKRDRQTTVRESIAVTCYCDVLQARPSDVPGVQGELLPAGAWGSAPHPQ